MWVRWERRCQSEVVDADEEGGRLKKEFKEEKEEKGCSNNFSVTVTDIKPNSYLLLLSITSTSAYMTT